MKSIPFQRHVCVFRFYLLRSGWFVIIQHLEISFLFVRPFSFLLSKEKWINNRLHSAGYEIFWHLLAHHQRISHGIHKWYTYKEIGIDYRCSIFKWKKFWNSYNRKLYFVHWRINWKIFIGFYVNLMYANLNETSCTHFALAWF